MLIIFYAYALVNINFDDFMPHSINYFAHLITVVSAFTYRTNRDLL